ncbi:MAG: hypothetical protein LBG08_03625 [Spirochaetaceae bacterium]|jgi:uncharacterized integral membrane protein|nr:hypothetical protein [Spirochaetaceae bacterium]
MPWKLLGFIVFLGILLVFIGLNLGNSCDISFGFTTVQAVPIYLTVFSAFVLGLLCAIPLSISIRFKKNKSPDTPAHSAGGVQGPQFGKKRNRKKKDESPAEGSPDTFGGGPYGIN